MTPAIIIVLVFLAITFIQSGYDKVVDWKGNVEWLKGHFSQTMLKNQVPQALILILILEILSGAFAVIGVIEILVNEGTQFAFFAAALSAITLLLLLLGQRIAKDYDGARTIVIYFVPTILLLSWL
jgi:uncharacterized membrane protein YphA (DoxX/SURF4 family)